MSKKTIVLTFYSLFLNILNAQDTFKCADGPFIYRNYKLTQVLGDFNNFYLSIYPDSVEHPVSSIAYNTNDNYIYSLMDYYEYQLLIKFNNQGEGTVIDTLFLDDNFLHQYNGDIPKSTNDFYYIGLSKIDFQTNGIGKISLTNSYPPEMTPLSTESGNPFNHSGGLVFSPVSGQLSTTGFTEEGFYLATINLETGIINDILFPINQMPDFFKGFSGLFFDNYGNLFGYSLGNLCGGCALIYHINTNTGIFTALGEINGETNAAAGDACNCPYIPGFQLSINPTSLYPCSEALFTYTIFYQEPKLQENILLTDTLPDGFIFSEIVYNNLGGTVEGIGTNQIKISNSTLEPELYRDSIQVLVSIPENALGAYQNQAYLTGFNSDFIAGNEIFYPSDYPNSVGISEDPTPFTIQSLELGSIENTFFLCPDSLLTIQPLEYASGFDFVWSTGSTEPQIQVSEAGNYELALSNNCESILVPIEVIDAGVSVDIGPDISAFPDDEIRLSATPYSLFELTNYSWSSSEFDSLFSCINCLETSFFPQNTGSLFFEAENEWGCLGFDELSIRLKYDVFFPNAFSPDNDGVNDFFFPHSKNPYLLTSFQVFDRWGSLIYSTENQETNNPNIGWDGRAKGLDLGSGTFVWMAEIQIGSESVLFKGDVLLVR